MSAPQPLRAAARVPELTMSVAVGHVDMIRCDMANLKEIVGAVVDQVITPPSHTTPRRAEALALALDVFTDHMIGQLNEATDKLLEASRDLK